MCECENVWNVNIISRILHHVSCILYPASRILLSLQIIKIPRPVYFQVSEHTGFGADADIEKPELTNR